MSDSYENPMTMVASDKRPFGFRDIIGYFFGDFGCNLSYSVVTYYLTIFLYVLYWYRSDTFCSLDDFDTCL